MRVCFIVNNVRTQKGTYTTLHLAASAHARGHEVAFVSADGLSFGEDGLVYGELVRARGPRKLDAPTFAKAVTSADAEPELGCLNEFDVVFLRYNPNVSGATEPTGFNPVIEFGRQLRQSGVLVVNDPDGLARAGSKLYLAGFPAEIRPRTLITRSVDRVRAFLRELDGPAIIKPLYGFGGQDVFYVGRGQQANLPQIVSTVRRGGYVIAQEYLPAVAKGDKRVLLLGGAPIRVGATIAAYRRMRPKDDIRNNMHVGGSRRKSTFSAAEQAICDLIRPRLVADGLYFVGVDIVGDKILEINVYAPGGIHNIDELYSVDVGAVVIEDLERKVELKSVYREPLPPHVMMRA